MYVAFARNACNLHDVDELYHISHTSVEQSYCALYFASELARGFFQVLSFGRSCKSHRGQLCGCINIFIKFNQF